MKLATVRQFALGLDGVTEEPHHHFSSFRYRGKIVATVPPGEDTIHVFPGEHDREMALAVYTDCMEKLLWGGKVVGVKIRLADAPPAAVKSLLSAAYALRLQQPPSVPQRRAAAPSKPARPAGNR